MSNNFDESNDDKGVDDNDVVSAMEKYGGSFIRALSHAFQRADGTNFEVLKNSFPKYWEEYKNLAIIHKSNQR